MMGQTKKILGLSFGSRGGNCDILLKQTLLSASKEEDVEVAYINTCGLKIDRCTGCGACDKLREEQGKMSICVRKDDFQFLEDEIMEADAIIAAAPVYCLAPVGQYKNLCDRIGPSHGYAAIREENKRRIALGWSKEQLIPEKYQKRRPLALISVGGARTPGWTSMGVAGMHILGFPSLMVPVSALDCYGMGDRVHPFTDDALIDFLAQMGKHVAKCVKLPVEEMSWLGEDGICPVCHCNQLTVRKGTTVECSVCGSIGNLSVENGSIHVEYPAEQILRSRYRVGGIDEHYEELEDMKKYFGKIYTENKEKIEAGMKTLEAVPEIKKTKVK